MSVEPRIRRPASAHVPRSNAEPAPGRPESGIAPLLRSPVGFLMIPQFAVIALACAIEPLRIANRYLGAPYSWRLLSVDGAAVVDDNGIPIQPHAAMRDAGPLGTLIICADIQPERYYTREMRQWLHRLDAAGATLGALDTGCFLLARAGLLTRSRVTMHWEVIGAFRERFPSITVAQTLYEVGDRRMTCAGGTAALDMMLNAIAIDHGTALANRVAEHCMHERIRTGDAGQRMVAAARSGIHHPGMARALQVLEESMDRAIGVDELAQRVRLSTRQLLRLFREHLGEGPAHLHRRLRLEHARTLLRNSSLSVTETAVATGFESAAHFSRVYRQQYGRSPGMERQRPTVGGPLQRDQSG
jgi:AraC family carnitine catabolism transcriptional activator